MAPDKSLIDNVTHDSSTGMINQPLPLQPLQIPVPPQRRHFFRFPIGSMPSPSHRGQLPVPLHPRHSTAPFFTTFFLAITTSTNPFPTNLTSYALCQYYPITADACKSKSRINYRKKRSTVTILYWSVYSLSYSAGNSQHYLMRTRYLRPLNEAHGTTDQRSLQ